MNYAYLLDVWRRRWWIVVLGVLLGPLLYFLFSLRSAPSTTPAAVYQAEVGLFILPSAVRMHLAPQIQTIDPGFPQDNHARAERALALKALIKSPKIAEAVFEALQSDLPSAVRKPEDLLAYIDGEVEGEILYIDARATDPDLAVRMATAWANAYEAEANAIFGGAMPLDNMTQSVEEARRAYQKAEENYVQALRDSPQGELRRELKYKTAWLNFVKMQLDELEQKRVDAMTLRERLAGMDKPDASTYWAFLILQTSSLAQDALIETQIYGTSSSYHVGADQRLPSGVLIAPESSDGTALLAPAQQPGPVPQPPSEKGNLFQNRQAFDTAITLGMAQIQPFLEQTTAEELGQDIEDLLDALDYKQRLLTQFLGQRFGIEGERMDAPRVVAQAEAHLRDLEAQIESEDYRLHSLALRRDVAEETYRALLKEASEGSVASSVGQGRVVRVALPATSRRVSAPTQGGALIPLRGFRGFAFAAIIGLLTSLGVVAALEFVDDKVRMRPQLVYGLGADKVVGALPVAKPTKQGKPAALIDSSAPFVQSVYQFRLVLRTRHPHLRSLVITSVSRGEGKTALAANMAVVAARAGERVVLVDANLRSPRLHHLFSLPRPTGLSEWLQNQDETLEAFLQETSVPGLHVLAAGTVGASSSGLLDSPRFDDLVRRLHDMADMVIFDSASSAECIDPWLVARKVEAALLVVRSGHESIDQVQTTLHQLEEVSAQVVGVVFNADPTWRIK